MDSLKQGTLSLIAGRLNWRSRNSDGGEFSYDARNRLRLVGATNNILLAANLISDAEIQQT